MTLGLLNRYVLRQILAPSILALAAIAFVAVANEIQEQIRNLPVAELTLGDVSRLMMYFMPMLVAYVVPVTYLMGIMLAFGRLSQQGEIVAMQAAGIPLKRIVMPVIVVGGVLSVACFLVQDRVQPWAIGKVYQLVESELPLRVTLDSLEPGVMHEFRGWRVYIGHRDPETGELRDIMILKPEDKHSGSVVYHAEAAQLTREGGRAVLAMRNGHYIPSASGSNVTPLTFETFRCELPKIKTRPFRRSYHARTMSELSETHDGIETSYKETASPLEKRELIKIRLEMAERISLPFACLAVSLVAAPLGARAKRSGRSYTFAVGFVIMLCYYVLKILMEPRSLHPLSVVMLRLWAPNLILCLAGLGFVWKVDRA